MLQTSTISVPISFSAPKRRGGFTLVELLVAASILSVVMLLVLSLVGSTATLTTLASRKIHADAGSRQALDRLAADLGQLILRDDLPLRIEKNVPADDGEEEKVDRNDALTFYAQAEGYFGDRGVAKLGYRLFGGALQRGAEGTFWDHNDEPGEEVDDGSEEDAPPAPASLPQLPFGAAMLTPVHEGDFEPVGVDIFRFELAFLMQDGSIKAATSHFLGANPGERVRAVIVAVAALDRKTRAMMTGTPDELAALLPDAVDSRDILSVWQEVLDDPGFYSTAENDPFPIAVRAAIRVHQRYLFIGPWGR